MSMYVIHVVYVTSVAVCASLYFIYCTYSAGEGDAGGAAVLGRNGAENIPMSKQRPRTSNGSPSNGSPSDSDTLRPGHGQTHQYNTSIVFHNLNFSRELSNAINGVCILIGVNIIYL